MKYGIDYQFMPKGARRPLDDGIIFPIEANEDTGTVILPNIGDYVEIQNGSARGAHASFSGRVKSRLFRYMRAGDELFCGVNIVVEEVDDAVFAQLIKE